MFHRPNLVVQPNVFHVSNKPNRKGRFLFRTISLSIVHDKPSDFLLAGWFSPLWNLNRSTSADFDANSLDRSNKNCGVIRSGCRNAGVVSYCSRRYTQEIGCILRGRLLADPLEFSSGCWNLDFPAGVADLGAPARFRRTHLSWLSGKLPASSTSAPLCCSLFSPRGCAELSIGCV